MEDTSYRHPHFSLTAPAPGNYRHIQVKPVTLALGGLVSGVDLSTVQPPEVYDEIADALWRYHVLFFRDQKLPAEAHVALGRHFGEPERHEIFEANPDHPEISILRNDETRPPEINLWHTDVTFRERPTRCSILYCLEAPPAGGDTLWLNQQLAFEMLSEPIRDLLLDLEAEHDVMHAYAGSTLLERAGGEAKIAELRRTNPPVTHPVVIAHPTTGKRGLFVSEGFTRRIKGLRRGESEALLGMLFEQLKTPEFQVRFSWAPGSIAMWDNFATQHYALADYYPQRRVMQRITVAGEKPAAARDRPKRASAAA